MSVDTDADAAELANWPEYDGLEDEAQSLQAWQDPDDGNLLVIEKDTGTSRDIMYGYRYFLVLRNAPFWEDDHVLQHIEKCKTLSEAEMAAEEYMADHRL